MRMTPSEYKQSCEPAPHDACLRMELLSEVGMLASLLVEGMPAHRDPLKIHLKGVLRCSARLSTWVPKKWVGPADPNYNNAKVVKCLADLIYRGTSPLETDVLYPAMLLCIRLGFDPEYLAREENGNF